PAVGIRRDDSRGEPVARRVRTGDRLLGVVDHLDGRDGTKALEPGELRFLGYPADERRPVAGAGDGPAGEHGRTGRHRRLDAPPAASGPRGLLTGSRAAGVFVGPMTVSSSCGSPALGPCAFSAGREVIAAAIARSTMIRRVDMQICPWCRYAPNAAADTA